MGYYVLAYKGFSHEGTVNMEGPKIKRMVPMLLLCKAVLTSYSLLPNSLGD